MSNLLKELNPSQQEAVTHESGPLLIIAGPGSGKTRTVADSIIYAIKIGRIVPNRIVAFTFTRKAVGELKDRVSKGIEEKIVNDIWISTFHSFCGSVLSKDIERLNIGNPQEFTLKELTRIYEERVRSQIDYIQHHKFVDAEEILNFINECKAKGIHPSKAVDDGLSPQMSQAYLEINKRYKQTQDDTDNYTRAQLFTKALFRDVPEVKTKWQEEFDLIFVDEYQDTDLIQYQIIKDLAEEHQNLRVVGDDDQGIYGWRGADIQNILSFEKDYPNAKVISLGENYRSTQSIVDASRALIDFNPDRRAKNLFTNNTEGHKVKHLYCKDCEEEAATIADFIHRAIQQGWTASDFAVLCRSTKVQAIHFEEAFSNLGILPHVVEDSSDTPTNGVSIMTIHKSKGLEFPNVFVAGVCSGLLPHYNSKEEDWDEELRLLYVAMTRAKNWLCLSSYNKDSSNKKRGPSRFLDFIPQSLIKRVKTLDNTPVPSKPAKPEKRGMLRNAEEPEKYTTPLPIGHQTVLGIDPGKKNVGWSITQRLSNAYTVHRCGTEHPNKQSINRKINELIRLHSPDAVAVEKLEGATDEWFRDVAGCVAQIRSIADQRDIESHFYSPQDIKYAVTGNRKASKEEVELAVKRVCILKENPESDHSADAIAASLCYLRNYLNYSRFQNNVRKQKHYNSGLTYLDDKRYNEAIVEFKKAINNAAMIDPMYIKAHCGLASAYLKLDELEEAENSVNEVLRLEPNYHLADEHLEAIKQTYYNRARNYLKNLHYNEAITDFNAVLRIDSSFIDAYCGLTQACLGRVNLSDAENYTNIWSAENYTNLIEDENYIAHLMDIDNLTDDENYIENAENYTENLRNAENHANLRDAENYIKEALKLDKNYQPALQIRENIKQKYCELVRVCLNRDKLTAAEGYANEALRLDSGYQPAFELLADITQAYCKRVRDPLDYQRCSEAITYFNAVLRIDSSFIDPYCGLAQAYLGWTNLSDAENYIEEALKLDKNYQPALQIRENIKQKYCELARDCLNRDKLTAAKDYANEALRLDSGYQPAFELLADITQVYYNRGCCHLKKKQYNEAASQFRIVAAMDSGYKNVQNYLGYAYYWIHDFENSIRSYQKAIAINSNDKNAYVMLGLTHISAGNYSQAVTRFQEAIDIDLNHKLAHLCLGRAYFKIRRLEKAKQSIRKTLDIDPTYQRALRLLEEIKEREIRVQEQLAHL